jgi:hypothetical protein
MEFRKEDLHWAADQGLLMPDQVDRLWEGLATRLQTKLTTEHRPGQDRPRFDFINVAYYFGALLVILAMAFYLSISWETAGPGVLLGITSLYMAAFFSVAHHLWVTRQLRTPGGLLATMGVCMTPPVAYSLEKLLGIWPGGSSPGNYQSFHSVISNGWTLMEIATLLVGLVTIRFFPFGFVTMPMAFCLWYLSMDLASPVMGTMGYHESAVFSCCFGLFVLAIAYILDLKGETREDYSYWLYLSGMLSFWIGLTLSGSGGELSFFVYGLINLALLLVAVLLQRRVFAVFGTLGVLAYLGHLAYNLFPNAFAFPIVLSLIGLLVIYLAVQVKQNEVAFNAALQRMVPTGLQELVPRR